MPGALAQPATLDAGGDATASNRVARVPRVKVVRKREPESNLPSGGFDGPSPGGAARADAVVDDDDDDDDTNANGREGKKAKLPAAAVAVLKEWLLSPEHFDYPYPSDEVGFSGRWCCGRGVPWRAGVGTWRAPAGLVFSGPTNAHGVLESRPVLAGFPLPLFACRRS